MLEMKSSNRPAYLQYLGEDSTKLSLNQGSEPMNLSAWLNPPMPPGAARLGAAEPLFAYAPLRIPALGRSPHCLPAQILVIVYPTAVFSMMILHFSARIPK